MARYVITDGSRWIQYKNGKYVPTSCPTFADEFSQKQAKSICENQLNKALRKVFHPEKCSDDLPCIKPCTDNDIKRTEKVMMSENIQRWLKKVSDLNGLATEATNRKKELVEQASYRLTIPGIGGECGATFGLMRTMFQGLFMAPHITMEALKGAIFCARIMELASFEVLPKYNDKRSDIIQAIKFGDPQKVINFCKGIQHGSPIDSHVECEPWAMPGYKDEVIMAAGAFIQGSSIELSADAPIRAPYIAYLQGGLTFDHAKIGILIALNNILKNQ